jgi:hypothetical protein
MPGGIPAMRYFSRARFGFVANRLFLCFRILVEHNRQRVRMIGFEVAIDQELLSIAADIVGEFISRRDVRAAPNLEQQDGRTAGEISFGLHRCRHQHS